MFKTISYFFDSYKESNLFYIFLIIPIGIGIFICSYLINFIYKKYIIRFIEKILLQSQYKLGKILIRFNIFSKLSYLIPILLIYLFLNFLINFHIKYIWVNILLFELLKITTIYILFVVLYFFMKLLNALEYYLHTLKHAKKHPIKSYIQIIKIFIWGIITIFVLSEFIQKSPWAFFTGLGAISAIFMLIFKDTILGFVASIQISAYDMVKYNDWITIPNYNVDGNVIEVSINTVKIKNFDNTIVSIPTHILINHSMKNWRGMYDSGGRRIKRSIYINIHSIKFIDEFFLSKLIESFYFAEKFKLKLIKIKENNKKNLRKKNQLTNVGLLRIYIKFFLDKNSKIHKNMTFLIRHLQSSSKGLPIEIYIFTKDTIWKNYEEIQAEIFDHLFAIIPIFGLNIFQDIYNN